MYCISGKSSYCKQRHSRLSEQFALLGGKMLEPMIKGQQYDHARAT